MSNHHDIRDPLIGHRFIQRSAFCALWSQAHELDNSSHSQSNVERPKGGIPSRASGSNVKQDGCGCVRTGMNYMRCPCLWLQCICRLKQIAIRLQSRMLMLTHLTGHHRKIAIKMLLHLDRDVEVVARSNVEHSHCWVIIPLSNDYTIILIEIYIYIFLCHCSHRNPIISPYHKHLALKAIINYWPLLTNLSHHYTPIFPLYSPRIRGQIRKIYQTYIKNKMTCNNIYIYIYIIYVYINKYNYIQ